MAENLNPKLPFTALALVISSSFGGCIHSCHIFLLNNLYFGKGEKGNFTLLASVMCIVSPWGLRDTSCITPSLQRRLHAQPYPLPSHPASTPPPPTQPSCTAQSSALWPTLLASVTWIVSPWGLRETSCITPNTSVSTEKVRSRPRSLMSWSKIHWKRIENNVLRTYKVEDLKYRQTMAPWCFFS